EPFIGSPISSPNSCFSYPCPSVLIRGLNSGTPLAHPHHPHRATAQRPQQPRSRLRHCREPINLRAPTHHIDANELNRVQVHGRARPILRPGNVIARSPSRTCV